MINVYLKYISFCLITTVTFSFFSCKKADHNKAEQINTSNDVLTARYEKLIQYPVDSLSFPRSVDISSGAINKVPSKDWTSGFFPGNLWQIYKLTGNQKFSNKAKDWTQFIEKEKFNNRTHDMGFKVWCSFGNIYEETKDEKYKEIIIKSAKTLASRFNKNVGCIRSWDFNKDIWEFPVIIDNMMNLELLFEATKISGDSTFHKIAVSHADTTIKNHFRPNSSSYHVVVYDTISGKVKDKVTHQGITNESSWARGQAWAIYGYTMAYRYTNDDRYLQQAQKTLNYFLAHDKLRKDGVPYWDFDDPKIPDAPRDVSAATIVTSASLELFKITKEKKYLEYADQMLNIFQSPEYLLEPNHETPFILSHSTGNHPKNDEIDSPIVYADYYFLEALRRKRNLKNN